MTEAMYVNVEGVEFEFEMSDAEPATWQHPGSPPEPTLCGATYGCADNFLLWLSELPYGEMVQHWPKVAPKQDAGLPFSLAHALMDVHVDAINEDISLQLADGWGR